MAIDSDSVYFAPKDYAHPVRRLGAVIIDIAFLFGILYPIGFVIAYTMVPASIRTQHRTPEVQREINKYVRPAQVPLMVGWLTFCVVYHVPLRRTRGGTLGYRVMGVRLVDRTGRPPQIRPLVKRFLIAIPSTMFFGLSYFSVFTTPKRQTFHDVWGGTWAVRRRAQPAGPAVTTYQTKFFGTIPTTFIDVEPLPAEPTPESAPVVSAPAEKPEAEPAAHA